MRSILAVLGGIALAVIYPTASASAETYTYVARTGDDAVFLDPSLLRRSGQAVSYWVVQVPAQPTDYSYFVMRQSLDCDTQRMRSTDMSVYGSDGELLTSDSRGTEEFYIEPGTIDQTTFNIVCRDGFATHPVFVAASPAELADKWRASIR